jgi:hypothetical protein
VSNPRDDWDQDERDALASVEDQLAAIRERHRSDPPLDLLRAADAGVLPDEQQAVVGRHLAESRWSRALVEGVSAADSGLSPDAEGRLLRRIQQEAALEGRPRRQWSWLHRSLFASGLATAALVAWFLTHPDDRGMSQDEAPPTVAVNEPAPAPFRLAFDKPEVRLSVTALTWRGTADTNPLLADLKPALDAYRQGDYALADREFSSLADRHPTSVEVHFYQGVSRLLLGDPQGAITSLAAAERSGDSTFAADVQWYRAIAEQHAGNPAEARTRLAALCQGAGAAATDRACMALAQLDAAPPTRP